MKNNEIYIDCLEKIISDNNLNKQVENLYEKTFLNRSKFFKKLHDGSKFSIYLPVSTGKYWNFNGRLFTNTSNTFTLSIDDVLNNIDRARMAN